MATRHKSPEKIQTSKDFLDVLLDCRAEDFTLEDIKALLLEIFLAGSETTATTIEWGMAELIRNPQIMKRVQHELDEILSVNRRVEGSDIEHLPYLCAVVKEVFRLHPAAPLLVPHKAESSCEVGGYLIRKDTKVLVNVWAMGRDAAIWTDPFMEGRNSNMDFRGHDWELIPFPFHFLARIPFPSCPQRGVGKPFPALRDCKCLVVRYLFVQQASSAPQDMVGIVGIEVPPEGESRGPHWKQSFSDHTQLW